MSVQLIDARAMALRHIAPTATWPSEGSTASILGTTYGFTELPISHMPESADLVEGSYTGRLGDSGEFTLTFPNAPGTKGLWRERFSVHQSLEFIEIYCDRVLEFVGSIQRVEVDRGSVTVSGPDAWALLRRVYEQDRSWTAAPHDVAVAYARVPVPTLADDFDVLSGWSVYQGGGSGTTAAASSGCVRVTTSALGLLRGIERSYTPASDTWRIVVNFARQSSVGLAGIKLTDGTNDDIAAILFGGTPPIIRLTASSSGSGDEVYVAMPNAPAAVMPLTLVLERQGRWLRGFANGRAIGPIAVVSASPTKLRIVADATTTGGTTDVDSVLVTEHQSFLARGSDQGDYVLPGDQPYGGLRGRYWNNKDMEGLPAVARYSRMMAPNRDPAAEQLDATIDMSAITLPVPADYFSVRWFGAVYLRLDLGNYVFETTSVDDGVRLWVGKTAWGDQIIDSWAAASGTKTATLTASSLGGKAGWYPIVLEFFEDAGSQAITLKFTPPGSTYTDPGGTSITASTKRTIPSTSLSPLGCYDNRVQGTTYFDLVQSASAQFGYELWCEPRQLESGSFPGLLVPRLRVGRDTDVKLDVEEKEGVEPALSPGTTLDGSDQAVALIGSGAGLADGKGSQVAAEVYDFGGIATSLFLLQGSVDAADIAFPDLLGARLSAELALRATPWEEVRATPRAQERLADTWPLSQTLAAMRWRPGDGLRLDVPDIGVVDDDPRRMVQVTRSFAAEGQTGAQVAFRQRPRSAARSVRGLLRAAISPQRSYQGQIKRISSNDSSADVMPPGSYSGYAILPLVVGEQIVKAVLHIYFDNGPRAWGVEINGTLVTSALGGPWTGSPTIIDITAFGTPASVSDPRLYARITNTSASTSAVVAFRITADVLT